MDCEVAVNMPKRLFDGIDDRHGSGILCSAASSVLGGVIHESSFARTLLYSGLSDAGIEPGEDRFATMMAVRCSFCKPIRQRLRRHVAGTFAGFVA
jgi:hypothetical protein